MRKFSEIFDPIVEDPNYYHYQKLVESCFDYIDELENGVANREEILSMLAYLAKHIYEFGYTDGLVVDNAPEEEVVKEKIYN